MTMVGTTLALPKRPQSFWRFLAPWLASYLGPCLVVSTVASVVFWATVWIDPTFAPHARQIIWLSLWPLGLAGGQWMLMRRYLPKAHTWALLMYWSLRRSSAAGVGQLYAQFD